MHSTGILVAIAAIGLFFSLWAIILIYYGAKNLDSCPSNDALPVWMVVQGLLFIVMKIIVCCISPDGEEGPAFAGFVAGVCCTCFIMGMVFVTVCTDCDKGLEFNERTGIWTGCKTDEVYVISLVSVVLFQIFVLIAIVFTCYKCVAYKIKATKKYADQSQTMTETTV